MSYAPFPVRTNPRASLNPALGYANSTSALPSPNLGIGNGLYSWAALDGVIPYTPAGLDTLEYWFLQWYYPGNVIPDPDGLPDQVRQWWADFYALPACQQYTDEVNRTGPYSGESAVAVYDGQTPALLAWEIRQLEYTGTLASAPAPLGGMFPALPSALLPLGAVGVVPSVADELVYRKQQVNAQWNAAVTDAPAWLAIYPNPPFPEVGNVALRAGEVDPTAGGVTKAQMDASYDAWYKALQGSPPGTVIPTSVYVPTKITASPAPAGAAVSTTGGVVDKTTVASVPNSSTQPANLPLANTTSLSSVLSSDTVKAVLVGVAAGVIVIALTRKSS